MQKPDIHIDVVLSDIDMPGKMNALASRSGRVQFAPEWTLFLQAPRSVQRMWRFSCARMARCSFKPYDHQIVLDRLKRLLAARAREAGS